MKPFFFVTPLSDFFFFSLIQRKFETFFSRGACFCCERAAEDFSRWFGLLQSLVSESIPFVAQSFKLRLPSGPNLVPELKQNLLMNIIISNVNLSSGLLYHTIKKILIPKSFHLGPSAGRKQQAGADEAGIRQGPRETGGGACTQGFVAAAAVKIKAFLVYLLKIAEQSDRVSLLIPHEMMIVFLLLWCCDGLLLH